MSSIPDELHDKAVFYKINNNLNVKTRLLDDVDIYSLLPYTTIQLQIESKVVSHILMVYYQNSPAFKIHPTVFMYSSFF